ncbi:MAG TPA: cytochrome c oxidase assembly protein [Gammaproteobacteria bacterium]|jgi:cytochrome c oxidase assembly protein subunit 11|nr:cytochrome c oxidase assembly protein [Gammaproteobacteria bacterium]
MSKPNLHRKVIVIGGAVAAVMFAFCFAIVPFYSLICRATGISTSVPDTLSVPSYVKEGDPAAENREVLVQFTATNHMGMPWEFYPKTKMIRVTVGKNAKVYFYAKNTTDKKMTVQAIPSMTPADGISHFHKIECFCFKQQTLDAHVERDMPLIFNIDKDLPKEVRVITLAYTLFDVTPNSPRK